MPRVKKEPAKKPAKQVPSAKRKTGGRPRIVVPWAQVDQMCSIQCTGVEIAAVLNIDYSTLERACKRDNGVSFAEYFQQKSAHGKMSLRRKQFQVAMDGNAQMLKHLGHHWLDQVDRTQQDLISSDGSLGGDVTFNFVAVDPDPDRDYDSE